MTDNFPSGSGFNFFLSWEAFEWVASGILGLLITIGSASFAWLWGISIRQEKLEVTVDHHSDEIRDIRDEMREGITKVNTKLDTIQESLPDREFIESQISLLTTRIDRLFDRIGLQK